jgi:AcrR family transcriptional regulator
MARRGSYAKGVAKREEILQRALDVIASEGFRGASVREIADAAGLSQAGLLHYFDSKEQLFVEILRARDRVDSEMLGLGDEDLSVHALVDGYLRIIRHNSEVPGLVQLFARMSVAAADPDHPAHAYFLERSAAFRSVLMHALTRAQATGELSDAVPADTVARMLQSVWDGAQLQWILDPRVDIAADVSAFFDVLSLIPQNPRLPEKEDA